MLIVDFDLGKPLILGSGAAPMDFDNLQIASNTNIRFVRRFATKMHIYMFNIATNREDASAATV